MKDFQPMSGDVLNPFTNEQEDDKWEQRQRNLGGSWWMRQAMGGETAYSERIEKQRQQEKGNK